MADCPVTSSWLDSYTSPSPLVTDCTKEVIDHESIREFCRASAATVPFLAFEFSCFDVVLVQLFRIRLV